jgi:hypothetical protein
VVQIDSSLPGSVRFFDANLRLSSTFSDFFYMYDNLPYGMQAREALDDEDLLSVPMPLELIDIDAYESLVLEEVCACACECRKVGKEPVSTAAVVESVAWTSTRTPLKLDFYGAQSETDEVDVR